MTFTCKPNCGQCCGPVPIPKATYEKNKHKAQPHYITDLGSAVLALQNGTPLCAFLAPDKKCAIYEERPDVCRKFGACEELPCPFLTPEGEPRCRQSRRAVERIMDKRIKRMEAIGNEVTEGI